MGERFDAVPVSQIAGSITNAVDRLSREKNMKRNSTLALSILVVATLGACATTMTGPGASASLMASSGSTVSGSVSFTEIDGKMRIEAQVAGLTPGEHGFHVHEIGDCSAADASSAKGHFNPAGKTHGHHGSEEHHGGDMPNLIANAQGEARYSAEVKGLSLNGTTGVLGRSVVIHADPDDYKSQPAGNSGKRIACGVIAAR
jgi:Cu-Zn family superoxide dismutase